MSKNPKSLSLTFCPAGTDGRIRALARGTGGEGEGGGATLATPRRRGAGQRLAGHRLAVHLHGGRADDRGALAGILAGLRATHY